MDDLFLDIVVLPSGEIFLLDEDELEQAYKNRMISENMYDLAWNESKEMMRQLQNDEFMIKKLAQEHKRVLELELK
ncbi:hypothetical protein [Rossellomorea sp. LJF3]|uniref:hypothetical protein n=1 Tax=Rossellomorea sp. LJF3 TaxID=3126099 RepID=UPI00300C4F5D